LERRGLGSASVFSSNHNPRKRIATFQAPSIDRLLPFGDHASQAAVTLGTGNVVGTWPRTIESRRRLSISASMTSRNFHPWFRFRNSRTWSYTGLNAVSEPKYLPSEHSTTRLITDVPHRGRSTSTPSATGACASIVLEGVDPADRVLG
jgi:hypothetical protein